MVELISRHSGLWYSANPYFPPIHREWRKSSLVSRVHTVHRVGNLFHERLSCLLFYPPPPFSPVAHAIASGYRPFLGSLAKKRRNSVKRAKRKKEEEDYLRGVKGREFWISRKRNNSSREEVYLGRKFCTSDVSSR